LLLSFTFQSKSFQIKLLLIWWLTPPGVLHRRRLPLETFCGELSVEDGSPWEHLGNMGLFDRVQPHGDHGVTVLVGILVKNDEKHHGFQAYLTGRVPHFQTKP